MTLFSWVTTTKRGTYAAITKRVPEQYRPQVSVLHPPAVSPARDVMCPVPLLLSQPPPPSLSPSLHPTSFNSKENFLHPFCIRTTCHAMPDVLCAVCCVCVCVWEGGGRRLRWCD
jgi:hypothetical protein